MPPDPHARWVSSLTPCGHEARTRGRPRPGDWITCPDGRCQGQRRVDAVAPVPVVLVQDPLFDVGDVAQANAREGSHAA